jgi:hypothetical protein
MSGIDEFLSQSGATFRVADDHATVQRLFVERGWSDGLPIVPPTRERVEAMLAYCDRDANAPLAAMPPRYGAVTPIRVAVNAVMAGCEPEFLPVVLAAAEAMCDKAFNLYACQATTHPVAPLVIVNGPIARELRMNSGINAFGPGNVANATIGRAIRLVLMNVGGGVPGAGDMATHGAPSKYSFCVAENEEENPWEPLHVERGFPREATTVTVVGAEPPHNVNDHSSTTAEGVLKLVAGTMRTTGNNDIYNYQDGTFPQPLLVFGPEHAQTIANGGLGKREVREYLFEHARVPLGAFSDEYLEMRFRRKYPDAPLSMLIPIFKRPEDLLIAVVGGPGKHSAVFPTFGATVPVTVALKTASGALARSVHDFTK